MDRSKATELGADKIGFFNAQWGTARWPAERVVKKLPVYRKLLKMLPNKVIETRFQM